MSRAVSIALASALVIGQSRGSDFRSAAAATSNPDTAVIRTTLDSLYRAGRLRFPLGHMVYATQLDEFYWWDNHIPIPLYLALSSINQRMNQHGNGP